ISKSIALWQQGSVVSSTWLDFSGEFTDDGVADLPKVNGLEATCSFSNCSVDFLSDSSVLKWRSFSDWNVAGFSNCVRVIFPTEVVLSSFPSLPELCATLAGWM